MKPLSPVCIIYNPNSTGDGKSNAQTLKRKLARKGITVELQETAHAGHATTLAAAFAEEHRHGIIISSSGDGGYHEVINGVLASKNPTMACGVLPSGNANDHYNFVHHGNTVQRIAQSDVEKIDVIKVKTPTWTAFAHSYVGLGMTSQIGKELTERKLNRFVETIVVLKHLFVLRKVKIRRWGRVRTYDNLVFSNSGRMSKYLTLSHKASVTDGKFEITRIKSSAPFGVIRHLLHASTKGVDDAPQARRYSCKALRNMHVQLDGEIYTVQSGEKILITCEPKLLRTIV